jgi:hypothetical protein
VRRVEPKVDESRAGDLHSRDATRRHIEALDQLLRDLARFPLKGSSQRHGEIRRPFAVCRIPRTLEDRVDGVGRAQVACRACKLGTNAVRGRAVHSPPDPPDEGGLDFDVSLAFPESFGASPLVDGPASDEAEPVEADASFFGC